MTMWIPTDAEIITMTVIAMKRLHGQKCSDSSHGTKNPNIRKSAKMTPNEKLTGPARLDPLALATRDRLFHRNARRTA